MNIHSFKRVHFVGIKGVAMTSLAIYCKESGMYVSGSDVKDVFPTDELLHKIGVSVHVGFDPNIIQTEKPDMIVYTGAHGGLHNEQVQAAIKLGIPVCPHGKALGLFMAGKRQISVAGSHGKTTTTAMIATIMVSAGLDPSYAIGSGVIAGLGLPGHFGKGEYFIAEADEYVTDPTSDATPRFLWQQPEVLVVTNIDFDHPDVYPTIGDVLKAFMQLVQRVSPKGTLILNTDDKQSKKLFGQKVRTQLVGKTKEASIQLVRVHSTLGKTSAVFNIDQTEKELTLAVAGVHNATNAGMAAAASLALGLSWGQIAKGIAVFGGAKRRLEKLAEIGSVVFYDDYAHHPREIEATLKAVRGWYPKQTIISVFQPHTYSRTKALLSEFAHSFTNADVVMLTDIYASAREHDTLGIGGSTLVSQVGKYKKDVRYTPSKNDVEKEVRDAIRKRNAVVVFMGAGDIYNWGSDIVKTLVKEMQHE